LVSGFEDGSGRFDLLSDPGDLAHGCRRFGRVASDAEEKLMLSGIGIVAVEPSGYKPTCPWFMSPKQNLCSADGGPSGCDIGAMYYDGCSPDWLLIGGIAAVTGALLIVGRR
jgi:hypothetical protein